MRIRYKAWARPELEDVYKRQVYHFHDGFLKYTNVMRGKYPKTLRKIKVEEELIPQRFLQASKGWIRYKPLLLSLIHIL